MESFGEPVCKCQINFMGMQPGDVPATSADIEKSKELLGYDPQTPVAIGVKNFVDWYRDYYGRDNRV